MFLYTTGSIITGVLVYEIVNYYYTNDLLKEKTKQLIELVCYIIRIIITQIKEIWKQIKETFHLLRNKIVSQKDDEIRFNRGNTISIERCQKSSIQ